MALTGALLLTSAPTASADYIRDKQWVVNAIDFEKVWAESRGEGVTVAVVDSGVDGSHPDLTGQVLKGKDFTGGGDAQNDTDGHGTGMASIIAGHGHGENNSAGVMGLAPKAKILPIKAGNGSVGEEWPSGVRYAVDHGASVINLSFGDSLAQPGSEGAEAIEYAQQHDVVVVASTGNEGAAGLEYPAKLPGVVAVGAVDESLKIWDDSNYGEGVTLVAPGAKIVRADTSQSNGYAEADGTSDATAYVSATAALIRAKYPDLTAGQVINRLIKSAYLPDDVTKAPDEEYGYGVIRPYASLTRDIPKGPKQGPLAQPSPSTSTNSGTASEDNDSTTQAKKKKKSSSGNILIIAGIAAAVVVIGILFAVLRNRRNGGNGGPGSGGGTPPHGTGYPPQPPTGYQPYPNTPPNQGYPTNQGYPPPPAQSPQHPNPYAQQPPSEDR
ncbi:type VII secretion-associated serine protease mycosin [Streptomyces jeddahensis]|uniref:type VII secretion-associated serine protease mycosin n=1 Tax=Streptomyces jeddahensis TaxID=1716141 RepID=UPI001E568369|nr:type VII secretion-associated serine protease mycosin [Streptomyces jeddahensis]